MFRLIIAALIVYVVWMLWKKTGNRPSKGPDVRNSKAPAEMIACARCGTFVLRSEAKRKNSDEFCSDECMKNS